MLPTESMEGEVAKKYQEQRIKYYESARELTLAMMQKAKGAKPLTSKPKPPASKKRSSASQPEGL